MYINFTEPSELPLGYSYDFINIVQQDATDSLFTLHESDRDCQEEPKEKCLTRKYAQWLTNICKCIPFQSRFLAEEVHNNFFFSEKIQITLVADLASGLTDFKSIFRSAYKVTQNKKTREKYG